MTELIAAPAGDPLGKRQALFGKSACFNFRHIAK